MGIVTMEPPSRRLGRTRLSDADIKQLAEVLRAGQSAGDGEVAKFYQTASQRARSAKRRVLALGVRADHRVWPVPGGYTWALTPADA